MSETKSAVPTMQDDRYDCQSCGLCCVYTFAEVDPHLPKVGDEHPAPWRGYVEVEFTAGVRYNDELLDEFEDCGVTWTCMRMEIPEGQNQPQCVALRGTLGVRVECSVYDGRPTCCRDFEPGSSACRKARRRAHNLGLVQLRRPSKTASNTDQAQPQQEAIAR